MCVQVPCVYIPHTASSVTARNTNCVRRKKFHRPTYVWPTNHNQSRVFVYAKRKFLSATSLLFVHVHVRVRVHVFVRVPVNVLCHVDANKKMSMNRNMNMYLDTDLAMDTDMDMDTGTDMDMVKDRHRCLLGHGHGIGQGQRIAEPRTRKYVTVHTTFKSNDMTPPPPQL